MVELIAIVVIMALMLLIILPSINNTIKQSEEKKKEEALNNIYMAAENFLMDNYEDYKIENVGDTTYIYITDLINNNYMSINTVNPNTNKTFNNNDAVKITRNDDKTFDYLIVPIELLYNVVIDNYPDLELGEDGCKMSTDTNYSYEKGCYIKGDTNDNYIWYSGFLWRIMGINDDGTIRLITDEIVTAIPWGASGTATNWESSHVREWLNDYFYSKIKGHDIINENTICISTTTNKSSSRVNCTNNLSKNPVNVEMITVDEYNLSGGASSYLNIKQYQWTATPYSSTFDLFIGPGGDVGNAYSNNANGVRAIINVNSETVITAGNGQILENWTDTEGPYILNDYKNSNITGKLNAKVTSGEYVMFANKKYRVVSIDDEGNIKLMLDGFYEKRNSTYFAAYGSNSTFTLSSGIGKLLNEDILNWLVSSDDINNRNKLVTNYIWYQNTFNYGNSYKLSLNETNPTRSIVATVGMIRIGEMLSGQSSSMLTNGYKTEKNFDNTVTYWTMIPYDGSNSWDVGINGDAYRSAVSSIMGVRPVIVVNSTVEIISGSGTWSKPYQI